MLSSTSSNKKASFSRILLFKFYHIEQLLKSKFVLHLLLPVGFRNFFPLRSSTSGKKSLLKFFMSTIVTCLIQFFFLYRVMNGSHNKQIHFLPLVSANKSPVLTPLKRSVVVYGHSLSFHCLSLQIHRREGHVTETRCMMKLHDVNMQQELD